MKKTLVFGLLLVSYLSFMSSCGSSEEHHHHGDEQHEHSHGEGDDHHHDHDHDHADHDHDHEDPESGKEYASAYVCPMHCEGSGSDSEGKCPVCEMDYKKNPNYKAEEEAPADSTL